MASPADVADLVKTIQHSLEKSDNDRIFDCLKQMKSSGLVKTMTVEILQSTKAGLVVAGLKKLPDLRISTLARELVDSWKEIARSSTSSSASGGALTSPPPAAPAPAASTSAEPEGLSSKHPYDQLYWRLSSSCPLPPSGDIQLSLGYVYADGPPQCASDRVRELRKGDKGKTGPVLLWMSRDQRVADNWALLRAQELALKRSSPLLVVFNLVPSFLGATARAYGFMLRGLRQVDQDCKALGIQFIVTLGNPVEQIPALVRHVDASHVVTDFSPLRISQEWKKGVVAALASTGCGVEEVDAHNVVPCWHASGKLEVGARTIRKKIHMGVHRYATPFPRLQAHPHALPASTVESMPVYGKQQEGSAGAGSSSSTLLRVASTTPSGLVDFPSLLPSLSIDFSVGEVSWAQPGERAARDAMTRFLPARLGKYEELRNDPCYPAAQSNLSPWLHYGQLAPQRVLLELKRVSGLATWAGLFPEGERKTAAQGFAEELVVRRELADNWCWYNPEYDKLSGAAEWAQATLSEHKKDKRAAVYSLAQFEAGKTHEALWNAGQMELVHRGKLHGFMRMYWAKKILEWSESPAAALDIAIRLNDKYNLDGRDPNGYVGCMWAIAGVHDMGWAERPIFGKIRYMNLDGCKRKFDVGRYISMWPVKALPQPPAPSQPGGVQAVQAYAAATATSSSS